MNDSHLWPARQVKTLANNYLRNEFFEIFVSQGKQVRSKTRFEKSQIKFRAIVLS